MKHVRIVSEGGLGRYTTITDADTGEPLTDIVAVEITITCDQVVKAKLTHAMVSVDIVAEVDEE